MKSDSSSQDTARAWKWGVRREELKAHPGQRPQLGASFPSLDPCSQVPLGSWESHLDPGPRRAAHGPMRGPGSCELVWPHWPRKPCWLTCVGTPVPQAYRSLCARSAMEVSLSNPSLLSPRLTVIVAPRAAAVPGRTLSLRRARRVAASGIGAAPFPYSEFFTPKAAFSMSSLARCLPQSARPWPSSVRPI